MISFLRRLVGLNRPAGSVQYEIYGLRQLLDVQPKYTNEKYGKPAGKKAGDSGDLSRWDFQHKVFYVGGWMPISEVNLAIMRPVEIARHVGLRRYIFKAISYVLDTRSARDL